MSKASQDGKCNAPTRWIARHPLLASVTVCGVHLASVLEHLESEPDTAGWEVVDRRSLRSKPPVLAGSLVGRRRQTSR